MSSESDERAVSIDSWPLAGKRALVWLLIGGAFTGLFALMDELRLSRPFDDLAEAMVTIVPVSMLAIAGLWHRSWRVIVILLAVLLLVGVFVLALELLNFRWTAR